MAKGGMCTVSAARGLAYVLVLLGAFACGSDDEAAPPSEEDCQPEVATSCAQGLVCEQVGQTRHQCLAPVIVAGRVLGITDGLPVLGATVVGLDANGAARTRVARSAADGRYELPVSMARHDDGTPTQEAITLRAAAADYRPFPEAPRTALPIDLGSASLSQAEAGATTASYRVENAATDVALIPMPTAERGGATVEGTVAANAPGGVLVLALADERAVSSAISDKDGAFVLFNVKPGTVQLEGYRAGLALAPNTLDVPADGLTAVTLSPSSATLASVSGSVNIVNAAGGLTTSVILVVASTFNPELARGEAPAGLRAANVSGAFKIDGVPPGRYAVLAAFENDGLVRDPDEGIAGTDIVYQDVSEAGGDLTLNQSFKVTGALAVVSPGATGVYVINAAPVNLVWQDDSSEDGYALRVYDALGNVVHENMDVPRVTGSANAQYTLDATGFQPGMLYQFRVWSWREHQDGRTHIAATEDLRGVFQIGL